MMTITGKSAVAGTHYWLVRKAGQIYQSTAYVDYAAIDHATYAIAATDCGFGVFTGSVPDDADTAELISQAGGTPATSDPPMFIKELVDLSGVVLDLGSLADTLAAIQERTDRLPDDPADASDIDVDTGNLSTLVQQAIDLVQQVKIVVQSRANIR